MFPLFDLPSLKRRALLRPSYFDDVEEQLPGFTLQRAASRTSSIYARLRKRYAKGLPWGTSPPTLIPAGLVPPALKLQGTPTLGCLLMVLRTHTPGLLGVATFDWSQDGGVTWNLNVATAASVSLGSTGLWALMSAGTFDATNVYAAAPPVPETILDWVAILVAGDVLEWHGVDPNEPAAARFVARADLVEKQVEEAANSQTGLFDLPLNEDSASAVSSGGPRGYSEQSPYRWTFLQKAAAEREELEAVIPTNKLVGGG